MSKKPFTNHEEKEKSENQAKWYRGQIMTILENCTDPYICKPCLHVINEALISMSKLTEEN